MPKLVFNGTLLFDFIVNIELNKNTFGKYLKKKSEL